MIAKIYQHKSRQNESYVKKRESYGKSNVGLEVYGQEHRRTNGNAGPECTDRIGGKGECSVMD